MRNTAGKKIAGQEDVDSDYLFGNSSNSESLRRVSRRLLQLAWEAVIHPSLVRQAKVRSTIQVRPTTSNARLRRLTMRSS